MKTPDEILAILRADMQAAKERGMKFVDGTFGDGKTHCCAVSANGIPKKGSAATFAAKRLGITNDQVWAIADGYDGSQRRKKRFSAFYAIGATLRAEFPPSNQ